MKLQHRTSSCFSVLAAALALLSSSGFADSGTAPIVELRFDGGFVNSGSCDATVTAKSYAAREGPYLIPGPWGRCLDMTSASRCTRLLGPEDNIKNLLYDHGLLPVGFEGPKNIHLFPRVRADRAVIHVVNWNVTASGAPDAFANVTVSLDRGWNWGKQPTATHYRPGQRAGVPLRAKVHARCIRITLPRLETWGILELDNLD